ncbi:large ribosomal subunit protein mL66-like [Branchiostoma lanceolatum]|uniref:large ribosomal subunit protein mL66-like n=1 Tax=Branchiostoma lanceolatum TaxID=7740 RepID=UPI0034562B6E
MAAPVLGKIFSLSRSVVSLSCSSVFRRTVFPVVCAVQSRGFREIKETKEGNVTVIEGVLTKPDGKIEELDNRHGACPICSHNLTFTWKDVHILSQFMRPDGKVMPQQVTGVCNTQHRKLFMAIEEAKRAGLFPDQNPTLDDAKAVRASEVPLNRFNDYCPPDWVVMKRMTDVPHPRIPYRKLRRYTKINPKIVRIAARKRGK